MSYNFLTSDIDIHEFTYPKSHTVDDFLLENNKDSILKLFDFLIGDKSLLHLYGFLGTGKRQIVNYITTFFDKNVIKLEFYCKQATVLDDIMLNFNDEIAKNPISQAINMNFKISTLSAKFLNYISSIKKPFVIILHSFDSILAENKSFFIDLLNELQKNNNIKVIITTRGMLIENTENLNIPQKLALKPFTKNIFKNFIDDKKIKYTDKALEDFYQITRGYYYYTALSLKIIQAMNMTLSDFVKKFNGSGMNFDTYLGIVYINLLPNPIKNFLWFLKTIRHGITINALTNLELYDEFSINYLKSNLMIFQVDNTIYIQDYFHQDIDVSIPKKIEIKLHHFIINMYENLLKESLINRSILMSRQSLRAEIEYHAQQTDNLENNENDIAKNTVQNKNSNNTSGINNTKQINQDNTNEDFVKEIKDLISQKQYTVAIEKCHKYIEDDKIGYERNIQIKLLHRK